MVVLVVVLDTVLDVTLDAERRDSLVAAASASVVPSLEHPPRRVATPSSPIKGMLNRFMDHFFTMSPAYGLTGN